MSFSFLTSWTYFTNLLMMFFEIWIKLLWYSHDRDSLVLKHFVSDAVRRIMIGHQFYMHMTDCYSSYHPFSSVLVSDIVSMFEAGRREKYPPNVTSYFWTSCATYIPAEMTHVSLSYRLFVLPRISAVVSPSLPKKRATRQGFSLVPCFQPLAIFDLVCWHQISKMIDGLRSHISKDGRRNTSLLQVFFIHFTIFRAKLELLYVCIFAQYF